MSNIEGPGNVVEWEDDPVPGREPKRARRPVVEETNLADSIGEISDLDASLEAAILADPDVPTLALPPTVDEFRPDKAYDPSAPLVVDTEGFLGATATPKPDSETNPAEVSARAAIRHGLDIHALRHACEAAMDSNGGMVEEIAVGIAAYCDYAMPELVKAKQARGDFTPLATNGNQDTSQGPLPTAGIVPFEAEGYEPLARTLAAAFEQSARGKGQRRHAAGGLPFDQQPIFQISRMVGLGGLAYQTMKKVQEANTMAARGDYDAARAEFLGAIVYAAACHLLTGELKVRDTD